MRVPGQQRAGPQEGLGSGVGMLPGPGVVQEPPGIAAIERDGISP
jgi:hypothetical protein